MAHRLGVVYDGLGFSPQLNPEGDDGGLGHKLVDFLSLDQFEALALTTEQAFEGSVGVGVDVVFLKHCEPCVLDDGVPQGIDLELVDPLRKVPIGVDPGQKTSHVLQLGEVDLRFLDLYLQTGDELALVDAVVELFVDGSLPRREDLGTLVLLEQTLETAHHFPREGLHHVPYFVVVLVESQQDVVVLGREIGGEQSAQVGWTTLKLESFCQLLQIVDIAEAAGQVLLRIQLCQFVLQLSQRFLQLAPQHIQRRVQVIALFPLLELFPGSCPQAIGRVLRQLRPMRVDYFVCRVVVLAAFGRMPVQCAGRQATFLTPQAVRVQAHDVHLLRWLLVGLLVGGGWRKTLHAGALMSLY